MQVEDVTRVGLASRRTVERKRHLTVCDSLLGQVVVDDEHVAARVGGVGGVAVLVVVHEVLADRGASHGRDVLHRRGVGGSGGNDDRLVQDAVPGERLADGGNGRGLLANGDVDADHVGLGLVDDGVDGDCRLTRLAVADNQLALATADGDHGVNGEKAGLHRLAHGLALHDARRLELDGTTVAGVDGAKAVNGLTQRVDDSTKHLAADGDVHDAAGGADLVTLLDGVDLAEQNGANLVLVQVLGEAVHAAASGRAGELQ